jgi:hypothetical protein
VRAASMAACSILAGTGPRWPKAARSEGAGMAWGEVGMDKDVERRMAADEGRGRQEHRRADVAPSRRCRARQRRQRRLRHGCGAVGGLPSCLSPHSARAHPRAGGAHGSSARAPLARRQRMPAVHRRRCRGNPALAARSPAMPQPQAAHARSIDGRTRDARVVLCQSRAGHAVKVECKSRHARWDGMRRYHWDAS